MKPVLFAVALTLALTAAAGATETTPEAAAFFNEGVTLANGGQFDKAIAVFEKSLGEDPGLTEAHEWIAHCLIMKGDYDKAIARYQIIAAQNPSSESKISLGLAYLRVGDVDMAVKTLSNAVQSDPGSANGWTNLSLAYLRQGKLAPAREAAEKALALKPRYAPALVNLGNVQLKEGNAEGAIASFTDALVADATQYDAYYGLGEANAYINNDKAAGDYYVKYLRSGTTDEQRRASAAQWLWEHERGAEIPK